MCYWFNTDSTFSILYNDMTQENLEIWIKNLLKNKNIHAFYISKHWISLREEVLKEQRYECQICKAKGYYSKATTVHHVHYVRKFPRLALSKYDNHGNRNLIAVCACCHNDIHKSDIKGFTNVERW